MNPSLPIIVIGAGVGGLSAAIRLAAHGQRVIVLEGSGAVGGKMSEHRADGFRWDTGPSVITMRHVFDDLFSAAGAKLEDYLTLLPVDPVTRYFYPDGTVLDATTDAARMSAQIERISGKADAAGYQAYLQYAARLHRITGSAFIYHDPPTLMRIARTPLRDMPAVDPLRTMDQAIRGFVTAPKLRQMLGRFATYVGASPYLAPATLNVIADVEMNGGVWYPQGGIYAIAAALERLAREKGVEIRPNTPVRNIVTDGNRVTGVQTDTAFIPARAVIANVDVALVYEKLLARDAMPASSARRVKRRAERLAAVEPSCSGFILMLGIEKEHAALIHHNILFSADYAREFDDIFKRGIPPDDPTIYIAITSKTDASHAPDGCENWFVLVNAPALGGSFDWQKDGDRYRDRVLDRLDSRGLNVRGAIHSEHRLTPLDLEARTGARRGALYGASSNDRLNALRRPHNRDPHIKGLYFAGGTAHPGGGVPMVALSGKAAIKCLIEDMG